MELEFFLSERARRERFAAGQRLPDEPVRLDVGHAELQPHTRELLFDTFGEGKTRIPAEVLQLDTVPERDWDFHLLAHSYRQACGRARWRKRLKVTAWLAALGLLVAFLSSPLVGVAGLALFTIALSVVALVFGMFLG